MNTYENISKELKQYFSNNPFLNQILKFDMFIVYGCVALMILGSLINMGSLISSIGHYGFIFGLLINFANDNKKVMYQGLFAYAGLQILLLLITILKHRDLDFHFLITALIFGGIGYLIFKKDSLN